jgi:hypothetical protein
MRPLDNPRVVATYEAGSPDMLSVVLESENALATQR